MAARLAAGEGLALSFLRVSSGRQFVAWACAAAAALALLVWVLRWERGRAPSRWSSVLVGNPQTGAALFQEKGCVRCHAASGLSWRRGPDTGDRASVFGPRDLVTGVWNHIPRIWERMRAERIPYAALTHEEMAHLFAYLYAARYATDQGDADRGRQLFAAKSCAACHALPGAPKTVAPVVGALGASDSPVRWAQAIWNHPRSPSDVSRPRFEGREMEDVLAYVRRERGVARPDGQVLGADPGRGWKLFQHRSCTTCHSIRDEAGHVGPELGSGRELPSTIAGLAGSLWNHALEMQKAMDERGVRRSHLAAAEMGDLIAFLYSSRYEEPGGSSRVGEVLFAERGCSRCHGPRAEGSGLGPGLRGRGRNFTSVTLAAALWQHGPRMYERARELRVPWPALAESDVGDLMTFLNTSPGR